MARFSGKVISRFCDIEWSPRSPDLTATDYFLWGYLKDRVYRSDPKPLEQLKENIETRISLIPLTMLSQVVGNLSIKINECVARKGGHLQDISFKK